MMHPKAGQRRPFEKTQKCPQCSVKSKLELSLLLVLQEQVKVRSK